MTSTMDDPFFDFDINLLQQVSVNPEVQTKLEKYRKSILTLKKKVVSANSLIKKYYAKREQLEQSEKNLFDSKEECKKICIDYRNALENCSRLEMDVQLLQNRNKELEEKYFKAENQYVAIQSHANQLQQLVIEHESQIEALKLEHKLCKSNSNNKTSDKGCEKQVRSLKNEIKTLRRHISLFKDVIFDKRKLKSKYKLILQRYEGYDGSSESEGETSDHGDYLFSPPTSPTCMDDDPEESICEKTSKTELLSKELIHIKMTENHDMLETSKRNENDGSSIDTGRGSSLACSDSEKVIQSPNYFLNDSPISDNSSNSKHDKHYVDVATSPIFIFETAQTSTSPISFDNSSVSQSLDSTQNNHAKITTAAVAVNTMSNCLTAGRPVSAIVNNKCVRSIFSPCRDKKGATNKTSKLTEANNERACLELNNSNNICEDNTNDCEIETILKSMRLNYNLITPIPISPSKSTRESSSSSIAANKPTENPKHFACLEAIEIKEENKKLHNSIADLAKEVMNIKNMLQNQIFPQKNSPCSTNELELNVDNIDNMMHDDEIIALSEDERPSSVQTAIIETKEQSTVRSPSSCSRGKYITSETEELSNETPIIVIETESSSPADDTPVPTKGLRLEFEDSTLFPEFDPPTNTDTEDIIVGPCGSNEMCDNNIPVYSPVRPKRRRNLSKLSILKKKMVPKSKIKGDTRPTRKITKRLRPKPITVKKKRKVLDTDNSASLNERSVYEKAVQVMFQIKAQQNTDTPITTCLQKIIDTVELNNSANTTNILDLINEMEFRPKAHLPNCMVGVETNQHLKDKSKCSSFKNRNKDYIENVPKDVNQTIKSSCTSRSLDLINNNNTNPNSMDPNTSEEQNKINSRNIDNNENGCSNVPVSNKNILENKSVSLNNTSNSLRTSKILDLINEIGDGPKITAKIIHIGNNNLNSKAPNSANYMVNNKFEFNSGQKSNKAKFDNESEQVNNTTQPSHTNQILEIANEIEFKSVSTAPKSVIENNRTSSEDMDTVNDNGKSLKGVLKTSSNDTFKCEGLQANKTSKEEFGISESNEKLIASQNKRRVTRSSAKNEIQAKKDQYNSDKNSVGILDINLQSIDGDKDIAYNHDRRKTLKRQSQDMGNSETPTKRILRSSTVQISNTDIKNEIAFETNTEKEMCVNNNKTVKRDITRESLKKNKEVINYRDLDMFLDGNNYTDESQGDGNVEDNNLERLDKDHENNILCTMLQKYGVSKLKFGKKKVSDNIQNLISEKLEKDIGKIIELPAEEAKGAMDELISEIRSYSHKEFIYGLMKYLQDPERKTELFKKAHTPPAPPMTKPEQILLYIILQLRDCWISVDFVDSVMRSIEYALFSINRTPEFHVIECMSHFYAVLCRYFKAKRRLRLFIMDAMYCLQFKSVTLIKQCIDVWMHVLPLAHMGIAKTPLVTCLVYLLHFYKCEDKFNRVSELRSILNRKYFFNITNWNENTILDMFRTAIMELKRNNLEMKMLKIALIILGKRLGPKWCHKNIINNLLKPIIEKNGVGEHIRVFCIAMLGPLLKPYPLEMKVHCEIITNELVDMLHKPASRVVQEAIVTSLLCLARHNQNHVVQALLYWKPKQVSPHLEEMLRTYVRSKSAKTWKSILTNVPK